ncbi:MAG: hypothetical protein HFJ37_03000 [Clostridia bacterium]|nr:hypothetical protein [Clostridia bacterium]
MEEIYYGSIQTPMGEIQGKIMFKTTGNKLEGYIETKGMKNYFTNGKVEKNHYVFSGSISYLLGKIKYEANAKIENGMLQAVVNTNLGKFNLYGKKDKN